MKQDCSENEEFQSQTLEKNTHRWYLHNMAHTDGGASGVNMVAEPGRFLAPRSSPDAAMAAVALGTADVALAGDTLGACARRFRPR